MVVDAEDVDSEDDEDWEECEAPAAPVVALALNLPLSSRTSASSGLEQHPTPVVLTAALPQVIHLTPTRHHHQIMKTQ